MTGKVNIRPVRKSDLGSLNEAIDRVARERLYLAFTEGFPIEAHQEFLEHILQEGLPQVVADHDDRIIGWCDILPLSGEGFSHVGKLGMGVLAEYRGHGIGKRLLEACLSAAKELKLERVELEVFSDNMKAIRLYEAFGFEKEGLKKQGRRLDGAYQDILLLALHLH